MSPQARDATIKHFSEKTFYRDGFLLTRMNLVNNVGVVVFLVSLKAGGVALNLTEASRVYLMDSWWNPAVGISLPHHEFSDVSSKLHRLNIVSINYSHFHAPFRYSLQRPWIEFTVLVNVDPSEQSNLSLKIASRAVLFKCVVS